VFRSLEGVSQQVEADFTASVPCGNLTLYGNVRARTKSTCYAVCNIVTVVAHREKKLNSVVPVRQ
jgi:hypothetical protein